MSSRLLVLLISVFSCVLADDCAICREIISDFNEELSKSESKTFGGGNSLWEESKVGSYATSETRFHTIVDKLHQRKSYSNQHYVLVDELEPKLLSWWISDFKSDPRSESHDIRRLEAALCIETMSLCCEFGFYGPECNACPTCLTIGGSCHGNGTRSGTGACICKSGYIGEVCGNCDLNTHYELPRAESNIVECSPCDEACIGCKGPSSKDCLKCNTTGWTVSVVGAEGEPIECLDIDECKTDVCPSNQFCVNKRGSFECRNCHLSCDGCTGAKSTDCIECASGFEMKSSKCVDINECSTKQHSCAIHDGEMCVNTEGNYKCKCKTDRIRDRFGKCIPDAAKLEKQRKAKAQSRKKSHRTIWTSKYLSHFLKYIVSLAVIAIILLSMRNYPIYSAFLAAGLGIFIYFYSSKLDKTFFGQL